MQPGQQLVALLPCPVKVPIEQAFEDFLTTLSPERREAIAYTLEGNANIEAAFYEAVEEIDALDNLPDIIITPGFNVFFEPLFVSRFIKPGLFTSVSDFAGDQHLARLGVLDPGGHYSMLAMNLLVPVVDLKRLGDRPLPQRWSDILKPEYANSIAIRGHKDGTFCETLLMTLYQENGADGLAALGRNVRYGWHPSQMVKAALGSDPESPAISIMPLFFAKRLQGRDDVRVVWPQDGALISPVTMLVKTKKREELKDLLGFLTGKQVSAIFADAFFPAVHPEVDNRLPEGATFKWIGWDYITRQDIKQLIATVNAAFCRDRAGA